MGDRGYVIRFFSDPGTIEAIERIAGADQPTAFIGAGASKEVGLPTWAELIDRLALRATDGLRPDLQASVVSFIKDSGLLAAAERIEHSLSDVDMEEEIRKAIYEADAPESVVPGPLSMSLAYLRAAVPETRLITTNYDQLLVQALRQIGQPAYSYCTNTTKLDAVVHLHGVVGFEPPADGVNDLVLTEHHFLAPQKGGWRRDVINSALASGPCVFVGASLTDLNLLLPLHQQAPQHRHVLLFVRDPNLDPTDRGEREKIDSARWAALNVQVLFADNYGDVAQFIDEVRLHRTQQDCGGLVARAVDWRDRCLGPLLPTANYDFRQMQDALSDDLSSFLVTLQDEHGLVNEVMQLGLFARGISDDALGDYATIVATSDRIMLDPRSSERFGLDRTTQWSGVRAMCSAVPVAEPKDHYASRWKFLLAMPIRLEAPFDLVVGAVVLGTTDPDSRLKSIGSPGKLLTSGLLSLMGALHAVGVELLGSKDE